jgi:hypothetical protein
VVNLTIKNQPLLTPNPSPNGEGSGLFLAGTDNIATLVLENMSSTGLWAFVKQLLAKNPRTLNRIRLIGIDVTDTDLTTVKTLMTLAGVDENGMSVSQSVVTGVISVPTAYESEIAAIELAFPELEVVAGTVMDDPIVTFAFGSNKSGETLTNTSFDAGGVAFTQVDDTHFEVQASPGTVLDITFTADNHADVAVHYTMTVTKTQNYQAAYMYQAIFTIRNGLSQPVVGATGVVNGKDYETDAEGKIRVRALSGATISGTLTKEGYGSLTINQVMPTTTADVGYTLYWYAEVENTFYVAMYDRGFSLSGIEVVVDGETKITDTGGRVKFVRSGNTTRNVKAYMDGEEIANQNITWDNNNNSILFNITRSDWKSIVTGPHIKPVVDGSSMYFHVVWYVGSQLLVTSNDANYSIDWGDGTITPASGTGQQQYAMPTGLAYNETCFLVKILNPTGVTAISATYVSYGIRALWSIGITNAKISAPNQAYAIGNDFFVNWYDGNGTDITSAFLACMNLFYLEPGLLSSLNNLKYMAYCFSGAGISPNGLLDGIDLSGLVDQNNKNTQIFSNCPFNELNVLDTSLIGLSGKIYTAMFYQSGGGTHPGNNKINVIIDASITSISESAFAYFGSSGSKMEWFECKAATPPALGADAFTDTNNVPIYVPDASLAAYKAAAGWSGIQSRLFAVSERS